MVFGTIILYECMLLSAFREWRCLGSLPRGCSFGCRQSMHHEEASSADYSTKALYLIVKWKGAEIGLPARKMRGKILLADSKGPHWKRCTTNCNIFILTKIVVK